MDTFDQSEHRTLSDAELETTFEQHERWLTSLGKEGGRADFTEADLSGRDLSNKDLSGARLSRANLEAASLNGSNLTEAHLEGAKLGRATLSGTILREADLRDADLRGADLSDARGLLFAQLAGADLGGALMPAKLDVEAGVRFAANAAGQARNLFLATLAAAVYSWIAIGSANDAQLINNAGAASLPIIETELPIVAFYLVAPVLLICLYSYFHLYLQQLWEALARLPAVFPNGEPLHNKVAPWLMVGLVSHYFPRLHPHRPPFFAFQRLLDIVLVWALVPMSLWWFWWRYLPKHDAAGTALHVALLSGSCGLALLFFEFARRTLLWKTSLGSIWTVARDSGMVRRGAVLVTAVLISSTAISVASRYDMTMIPRAAQLRRADLSGADLEGANLKLANMHEAILENAFLRRSNLSGADLHGANLSGATLKWARLTEAKMDGAVLSWANLEEANLQRAHLVKADLTGAVLTRADLRGANFGGGYHLSAFAPEGRDRTRLIEADLSNADLRGADLRGADLTRANIAWARLQGADLRSADLTDLIFIEDPAIEEMLTFTGDQSLDGANILGVRNPPEGFLQWAHLRGAVEMESETKWFEVRHLAMRRAEAMR